MTFRFPLRHWMYSPAPPSLLADAGRGSSSLQGKALLSPAASLRTFSSAFASGAFRTGSERAFEAGARILALTSISPSSAWPTRWATAPRDPTTAKNCSICAVPSWRSGGSTFAAIGPPGDPIMACICIRFFRLNGAPLNLIVGNVHGCLRTLDRALSEFQFVLHRDQLFGVGDLVIRRPDTQGAVLPPSTTPGPSVEST